jgi:hypothetical protein
MSMSRPHQSHGALREQTVSKIRANLDQSGTSTKGRLPRKINEQPVAHTDEMRSVMGSNPTVTAIVMSQDVVND